MIKRLVYTLVFLVLLFGEDAAAFADRSRMTNEGLTDRLVLTNAAEFEDFIIGKRRHEFCISDFDCTFPGEICNFYGRCVVGSANLFDNPMESQLPVHDMDVKVDAVHKPGHRCTNDKDCTLPGTLCDSALGFCNLSPEVKLIKPVVSPLTCFTQSSPRMPMIKEKCDGVHDTGSDISQAERNKIVDFVNEFRAMINNNCTLGLGIPKPALNYRKVKYNCEFENKSQFDCHDEIHPKTFKSDNETWRSFGEKQDAIYRQALFHRWSPWANQLLVNTSTSTIANHDDKAVFMKLFLSEDVTEVGCYIKVCGAHEYIACKTNHDRNLPNESPLYTPGERCNADSDCTLPGYTTCDVAVGLCDYKSRAERSVEALGSQCEDKRNVYIDLVQEDCEPGGIYTGNSIGNKEREIIVQTVNDYRARVNNKCDLGKGIVKPITNYRKVKYSCALELAARRDFSSWNPILFKSSRDVLRYFRPLARSYRTSVFVAGAPRTEDMLIDPDNQTADVSDTVRSYLRFMLSPDVTEIGCYVEIGDGHEYMACKTDFDILAPKERPLYTPGNRCVFDRDCTLPGYGRCDTISGLCDVTPRSRHVSVENNNASKCKDIPQVYVERETEKCSPTYDTGSDMSTKEREAIVKVANQFRALMNNNCDLGKGNVTAYNNYCKLKYSCQYEEDSKLDCDNANLAFFKTDDWTWRRKAEVGTNRTRPLFLTGTPRNQDLLIQPPDNSIESSEEMKHFIRLLLNPYAKKIGCFTKVRNGTEYYACKSGDAIAGSKYMGSYNGKRCNTDSDCTFYDYGICDIESGMCEAF